MKLVLDECILNKKLRKWLRESEDYEFMLCFETGYKSGDDDEILIEKAGELDCLVLTIDFSTITEDKFPPCTHKGILQFDKNKISADYIVPRLEALRKLKLEDKAIGHFTYFTDDGIKIVTHHKDPIERNFDDFEEFKDIEKK
jgi:hypothetical protein